MKLLVENRRSRTAAIVFGLFNPLPYAFFVAALIFDATYADSGEILWAKSAAWLICIGLVFAIVPRLINLVQVWVTRTRPHLSAERLSFWLNLLAIVVATINAFVHSRDAYASMPEGVLLSILTVALLMVADVILTWHRFAAVEQR